VLVDAGGAPEFVRAGEDAVLAPPGDAGAFAAEVRALLGDELRRRMMSAAALKSPLRPTPAAMARRMVGLYEELLLGSVGTAELLRAADSSEPQTP
jgi:glycosyltransferase involved in cell wall biosynthesis